MAEIINLKITNPKIKRTTKDKSDTSTKILGEGELLGVRYDDGSFTLKLGKTGVQVKDLKELKSGGGGDVSGKQDILIHSDLTPASGATIELDSQKFLRVSVADNLTINLKDPISGTATTPEYDAEFNFATSVSHTITFPTGTIIRTNDPDVNIASNKISFNNTTPKSLQVRIQNGVATLTNASIGGTISNLDDFLKDLVITSVTDSTSIALESKNYTKIAPTISTSAGVTINLESAAGKTKIFKGSIKLNEASESGAVNVNFPSGTTIVTNDANIAINNNQAQFKTSEEILFNIYDGYCELINPTISAQIPTKISQLVNDSGFILKNETLRTIQTSAKLYPDGYSKIVGTSDVNITLSNKFIGDAIDIPSTKIPCYAAYVELSENKKITFPSGLTIKTDDTENIEIASNVVTAKRNVKLEFNIQNNSCFIYVWWADVPHNVELKLTNCQGELKQINSEMILTLIPDTGYNLPEQSAIVLEGITLTSYNKETGIIKFNLPDDDASITITATII